MAVVDTYTKLLMHMDELPFKDEVGNAVTNIGVSVDSSNPKYGKRSAYFNGSSYLAVPNSVCSFGAGDFTIEAYVKLSSGTASPILVGNYNGNSNLSGICLADSGAEEKVTFYNMSVNKTLMSTKRINDNIYHHLALVRYKGVLMLYIDGVLDIQMNYASNVYFNATSNICIGYHGRGGFLTGSVDELRISDVARYTSNFMPPTKLFLVKQGDKYYNVNYNYQELGMPSDNTQLKNWFDTYGSQEINAITKKLNYKRTSLIKDESTGIWKSTLDANDILSNIKKVDIDNVYKAIQYNCVNPYRILDSLQSSFKIKTKLSNNW